MKTGIIDRFEGQYAVVEFGANMTDILKADLPSGVKVGDVLQFTDTGIEVDKEARSQREAEIERLANELFEE